MKEMSIGRKIDDLGRVVLPLEVQRVLEIEQGDTVNFVLNEADKTVILKKYKPSCCCCHSFDALKLLPNGQQICAGCLAKVSDLL